MSFEGMEDEVMTLFRKIENRRRGLGSCLNGMDSRTAKRLRKEFKKLECRENYEERGEEEGYSCKE